MEIGRSIIEGCNKGDERAYYSLYRSTYNYLISLSRRYARDEQDACNLHNSSFTKIVLNLDKYRSDIPFKNWMRRIAINHIIDQIRHEKTYRIKLEEANKLNASTDSVAVNSGELKLNFEGLLDLLNLLPVATRNVFNLYALDGYSHKEIADKLDITVGTSKWHVSQARKILQSHLAKRTALENNIKPSIIVNISQS